MADVELEATMLRGAAPSFADAADRVAALIQRAKDANAQYDSRLGDDSYAQAALDGVKGLNTKERGLITALEALEQRLRGYATAVLGAANVVQAHDELSADGLSADGGY